VSTTLCGFLPPIIRVRYFSRQLRRIPPTRIPPILCYTAGNCHRTAPIHQHYVLQHHQSFHRPFLYAPIMSSDDDMPLARTNGHCKSCALLSQNPKAILYPLCIRFSWGSTQYPKLQPRPVNSVCYYDTITLRYEESHALTLPSR
jgi:hypothetical protein